VVPYVDVRGLLRSLDKLEMTASCVSGVGCGPYAVESECRSVGDDVSVVPIVECGIRAGTGPAPTVGGCNAIGSTGPWAPTRLSPCYLETNVSWKMVMPISRYLSRSSGAVGIAIPRAT
jgi:hypothetical protein